jgi:hypothetical protein
LVPQNFELGTSSNEVNQYLFLKEIMKLSLAILKPPDIRAINNPYQSICLLKVIPPIRADCFLTPDIPYIQRVPGKRRFLNLFQNEIVCVKFGSGLIK